MSEIQELEGYQCQLIKIKNLCEECSERIERKFNQKDDEKMVEIISELKKECGNYINDLIF